jgi:hypothetical protein
MAQLRAQGMTWLRSIRSYCDLEGHTLQSGFGFALTLALQIKDCTSNVSAHYHELAHACQARTYFNTSFKSRESPLVDS